MIQKGIALIIVSEIVIIVIDLIGRIIHLKGNLIKTLFAIILTTKSDKVMTVTDKAQISKTVVQPTYGTAEITMNSYHYQTSKYKYLILQLQRKLGYKIAEINPGEVENIINNDL